MINRNLICGKLMSVKKLVKHALLIESHKLKYMNHLLAISCLKNKNNNGKKLKKYVIKYQIKMVNKLEKLDNGNRLNNKTTSTFIEQLINNPHNLPPTLHFSLLQHSHSNKQNCLRLQQLNSSNYNQKYKINLHQKYHLKFVIKLTIPI
jgi:hypothetical protein